MIESSHGKLGVVNSKEQYKALEIHWGSKYIQATIYTRRLLESGNESCYKMTRLDENESKRIIKES